MSLPEGDNISAVLYDKRDMRLEHWPISYPGKGEVLIRMENCGICGTDVHIWKQGQVGDHVFTDPLVLGHEASGEVIATGSDVTHLKVGDRVATELCSDCRRFCDLCRAGRYNLCKMNQLTFNGITQYLTYYADLCHKLPENLSFEEGALAEPLAVGVSACWRAGLSLGSQVLVCGAGAIGLSSMLAAKSMGASEVCITDISKWRLDLARRMGADHTVLVDTSDSRNVAAQITERLGDNPEFTIETSGAEQGLSAGIYATKSGGVMVPVGLDPPVVTLPIVNAATREVDIKGILSYTGKHYRAGISAMATGKVDAKPMITHRYNLIDTLKAFDVADSRADGVLKVMISLSSKY